MKRGIGSDDNKRPSKRLKAEDPLQITQDEVKIVARRLFSEEEPIELSVILNNTTIIELAKLYLKKLKQRYTYSIEQTKYTIRTNVEPSDLKFLFSGRMYSAHKYGSPNRLLSEIIRTYEIEKNTVKMHVQLYVTGKQGYPLNHHIQKNIPSLQKLCLFKFKDMLATGIIEKEDIQKNLPTDMITPKSWAKIFK